MERFAERPAASEVYTVTDFWPVILKTVPPTVMTREEAYAKAPAMMVTYIPATNPHPEDKKEEREIAENPPFGGKPVRYYIGN